MENTTTQKNTEPVSNTKKVIRARFWIFTWNNYPNDWEKIIRKAFSSSKKFAMQEEKGENGTPHIQGYVEFENARTFDGMKKMNKEIHWEKSRSDAAIKYCLKEDTRNGKQVTKGIYMGEDLPTKEQLFPWQKDILEILDSKPNNRKIYWFWESKGNAGKSMFAKYLAYHHVNICVITASKSADILTCAEEKYTAYVFDFPRHLGEFLPWNAIEQLKNGCITDCKLKKKGIRLVFPSPHVIIFSNYEPEIDKLSADRWEIREIGK